MTLRDGTRFPLVSRSHAAGNRYWPQRIAPAVVLMVGCGVLLSAPQSSPDLSQQIFDVMSHAPAIVPGHRILHAKGIVCQGTFKPSPGAAAISRAGHFRGPAVPVTVRLSDSTPDLAIPDNSPDASPRGMAIRFMAGPGTDIVANSHNGFIVGTGEEFLGLQKALAATDPSKPHPWPIEAFLGGHPRALKFVQDPKPVPASFAGESFYGNNAFIFVNKDGLKKTVRYQIIPQAGSQYLDDAAAKAKPPNFLVDELRDRLAKGPVQFRLLVQIAETGDCTNDSSVVWSEDRKKVELGTITITSLAADNTAAEKQLAFDPTKLTDGIALSDDPLPALRSRVYAMAAAFRRSH
jgi:catalase